MYFLDKIVYDIINYFMFILQFIHSNNSLAESLIHSFIYPLIYPPIYSSIHLISFYIFVQRTFDMDCSFLHLQKKVSDIV